MSKAKETRFKQTKIGEIPESWDVLKLSETLDLVIDHRGLTPKKLGSGFSESGILVISANNVKDGYLDLENVRYISRSLYERWMTEELKEGDVLMTSEGPLGNLVYLKDMTNYCLGQRLFGLRASSKLLNSKFLFYILSSTQIQKQLNKRATGSTVRGIRQAELVKIEVPVPSMEEQRKISGVLSCLDDFLFLNKKILMEHSKLKKGLMQHLLTRGIGHTRFKQTKIGEIPESWEPVSLVSVCKGSGEYGAGESAIDQRDDYPRYVRITDVDESGWLLNETWKSIAPNEASRYILQKGDFLFARTGATVGKTYLYREEDGLCAFAGYLIRFRPDSSKLQPEYLFHFTHSDIYYKWVEKIARQTAQPNINAKEYGHLMIPLPSIHEQERIVNILNSFDRNIQLEIETKRNLESLKKGLMQVLLTGKVRVKI